MKPTVKFVFPDVHMGAQHDGLDEMIRTYKRKNPTFAQAIKNGGLIIFLNTTKTRFKMYSENGEVIGYWRSRDGKKLSQEKINEIPATFGGSVEYSRAAQNALLKYLEIERQEQALAQ